MQGSEWFFLSVLILWQIAFLAGRKVYRQRKDWHDSPARIPALSMFFTFPYFVLSFFALTNKDRYPFLAYFNIVTFAISSLVALVLMIKKIAQTSDQTKP